MKPNRSITAVGGAVLVGVLACTGWAQPANTPKGENPANDRPRLAQNDQQERAAQEKQQRDAFIRQGLAQLGFGEPETQEAIIAHLDARDALEKKLRGYQLQIVQGLMTLDDNQVATMLTQYKAAQETYRAKLLETDAALDEQIQYSEKPKLELALRLFGGLGADPSTLRTLYESQRAR